MREAVADYLRANNGIIKASAARHEGINNKELQRLSDAGLLERISRGLYISAEDMPDEYLLAQYRCTKGVFSHETALFFHGLADRTPLQLMLTIPSGYNTTLLKDRETYRFFYCKSSVHSLAITTTLSPQGNELRVYDRERTLCDCIKKRDSLDADLVLSAVKQYMQDGGNDYAKLLSYAELFKIRNTVKQYMEVLA